MTEEEIARKDKIIVALFLVLGKAVNQLSAGQRKACAVRESEIREAWTNKHSPVRIVSETRMREAWQMAEAWGPMEERVFNVEIERYEYHGDWHEV